MKPAAASLALLLLTAAAPSDVSVPPDVKAAVIAHFSSFFVVPETAVWQFDSVTPFILGGTLVCGKVNFQNSLRRYVGMTPFYIVVGNHGRTGDSGLMALNPEDDPTGSNYAAYRKICKPTH